MSFERKKQDIFGLTLDDAIWRNIEKLEKPSSRLNDSNEQVLNQNLTSVNSSPVRQKSKYVSSCFNYGPPSLNTKNPFNQKEMKKESSDLEIYHINAIHQEINEEESILIKDPVRLQEDEQSHSLFQYDLLFNQKINKETQSCPCCPPLSKSPRENQQQKDFIITTRDDDLPFIPINIKHILEKPSSDNNLLEEATRKTAPSVDPLKDVNNNSMSNKIEGGRLNKQNNLHTPEEKNVQPVTNPLVDLNNNNDFEHADERLDSVTKLMNKPVQSISLNGLVLNKPADELKEGESKVFTLEEKTIQPANPLTNSNNNDSVTASLKGSVLNKPVVSRLNNPSNVTIPTEKTVQQIKNMNDAMVKPELNGQESKSQPSILTVEKVQSILEFYHSTSEDLKIERKAQENVISYSDEEEEPLDDIDFFDISNVKLFKCSQCDKEFPDKNSVRKHTINDHRYICAICNKILYHAKHKQRHEEKVHGNYTMYARNKSKRKGSRQANGKRNPHSYFCCGQNFKSGREFGIHKSTHKFMGKRKIAILE